MNEFLRNFIMTGIRNMIERDVPLYQVYKYAAGWYDKGILTEDDLREIEEKYAEKAEAAEEENEATV